jgi:uncharacterized protein (TIGR03066 family)
MKRMMFALLALSMVGLAGCGGSSTSGGGSDNKGGGNSKLVGVWNDPDDHGTIEFMADGKVKMVDGGKTIEASYIYEGDKLTMTMLDPTGKSKDKKSETWTVKKLTDTEMTTVDSKGKEDTLKKK